MIETINGVHDCYHRNIHGKKPVDIDNLDCMLKDARRMSELQFKHLYGAKIFRYYGPDNSIRVLSTFKEPKVIPSPLPRAPSHKNDPKKDDQIVFIVDDEPAYYGRILWVNKSDDRAGILIYKDEEYESIDLGELESTNAHGLRIRWRVYR